MQQTQADFSELNTMLTLLGNREQDYYTLKQDNSNVKFDYKLDLDVVKKKLKQLESYSTIGNKEDIEKLRSILRKVD